MLFTHVAFPDGRGNRSAPPGGIDNGMRLDLPVIGEEPPVAPTARARAANFDPTPATPVGQMPPQCLVVEGAMARGPRVGQLPLGSVERGEVQNKAAVQLLNRVQRPGGL